MRLPITSTTAEAMTWKEAYWKKAFEPTQKEPFELGDNKERYENGTHEDAHRGGNKAVSNHDDGDGLGRGEQDHDDGVDDGSEEVRHTRRIDAGLEVRDARNDSLQLGLVDTAG